MSKRPERLYDVARLCGRLRNGVQWQKGLVGALVPDVDEANANMIEAADEIDGRIKMKWQPIETAPKDGTEILVFCPYEGVGSVFWRKSKNNHRGGWQVCSFDVADFETNAEPCPTHWLPLPAAPTPEPHVRVWQLGDGPILGKIRPTQMREDEKEKEIEMATTLNDKMKKIGAQRRKKIEKRAAELIAEEILRDLREASIHMEGVLKATAVRLGETEQELERLTELRATQHALEEGHIMTSHKNRLIYDSQTGEINPDAPTPPISDDVAGLCERLRDWAEHNRFLGVSEEANATAFICKEAAAMLQSQAEEIEASNRRNRQFLLQIDAQNTQLLALQQENERLTELRATQHALEEGYIERHAAAERYRAALEQIVAYFDGGGTANDPAILSCARRALERQTP